MAVHAWRRIIDNSKLKTGVFRYGLQKTNSMRCMKTQYKSQIAFPFYRDNSRVKIYPNPLFPAILGELLILILIERYVTKAFLFEMYCAL
jgi:hypothetical protein